MRFILKLLVMLLLAWLMLGLIPSRYQAYHQYKAAEKNFDTVEHEWKVKLDDDGKAPPELQRRMDEAVMRYINAEQRWVYCLKHLLW